MSQNTDNPSESDAVLVERHEGWAEVIFNRPDKRNAINGPFGAALADALESLAEDETTGVLVLRGAGGAFCSGLDLNDFNADPSPDWLAGWGDTWRRAHRALFNCPQTIVGAMERYAINGGAALALATDLLVVGRQSWLQVGEVRQGMGAPYNLAWLRLRHAEAVTSRLTLTGRRFAGEELLAIGVAHEVVDDAEIVSRAQELAAELAAYPEGALRRIKAVSRACSVATDADSWFDHVIASDPLPAGRVKPGRQE